MALLATAALCIVTWAIPRGGRDGCGPHWMAADDVRTNNGQIAHLGYNTAVNVFCDRAGNQTLGGNEYLSMAERVWLDYGQNPATTGLNGYVYFEIHNDKAGNHVVDVTQCKSYLKDLSTPSNKCWGPKNHDTKGGTFLLPNNTSISYRAHGNPLPPHPQFDALHKTAKTRGPILPLENKNKGNTLSPFPTSTFDDIIPLRCHSHNDYERPTALYSALSAGCISVEADIYLHGEKLVVGHKDPGVNGQTLQDLYLDPIKKILDGRGHIFAARQNQSLSLLIDFKNNADATWDVLVKALTPLRDAGYLSFWNGTEFREGRVTVVATGNAIVDGRIPRPIAKAIDDAANPGRALFVDAKIHKDMSRFDASIAYYASASFKDAVQGGGKIQGGSLKKLRDQIRAAHEKGFKVRYWDIPSKDQWQQLIDEGVDRLNVDDLQDVAGIDFHL